MYKLIEVVGTSKESFAVATKNAISEAGKTLKGLAWFEIVEMRGNIKNNKVDEFQVKVKVAFKIMR